MSRVTFFLALLLSLSSARAGTLSTRDGQTFSGALRLEGTNILVAGTTGGTNVFPLTSVARAVFADLTPPTTSKPRHKTYIKKEKKFQPEGAGHLSAEYFADHEMKDRRLFRREAVINFDWPDNTTPDPQVPPRFAARWTGRLHVPGLNGAAYSNTLVVRFDGGARLWLDDKLLLDTWNKPQPGQTNEFPFIAGRTYQFRLEYYRNETNAFAWVHRWTINHGRMKPVLSGYFLPTQDAGEPPQIEFVSPEDHAALRRPASLPLEAEIAQRDRSIQFVRFLEGERLLGTVPKPPFIVTLDKPTPGSHVFMAQALDDKSLTVTSRPLTVHIAGDGNGTLPEPWADLALGVPREKVEAVFRNGALALTEAGGAMQGQVDSFGCVFQNFEGDFDFTACLAKFESVAPDAQPQAGLFISGDFRLESPRLALLAGPDGNAVSLCRAEPGHLPEPATRRVELPVWLRLTRREDKVRMFTSADGSQWQAAGFGQFTLPEQAAVGLAVCTKSTNASARAIFDHITITPPAASLGLEARGALLVSGSFLAEDVLLLKQLALDGETAKVKLAGEAKATGYPSAHFARLLWAPLSGEAQQALNGKTGLLMENGDFLEAEVTAMHYGHVTVESLILGRKTYKGDALSAICLRETKPAAMPFLVTTRSGSRILAKSINVIREYVNVEEPLLGVITIPLPSLAEIQGR